MWGIVSYLEDFGGGIEMGDESSRKIVGGRMVDCWGVR